MIDLKDQQYLYDLLLTHLELNPNDISLPKLVVDETDCELDLEHIHPWFDTLGWFSSASPGEVTLAPRCIELVAQKLHCLPLHLACLVYVHEVAHYLHFAQNPRGFLNYTPKEERTSYVESFAQLCTHAVARFFDSLGYGHLKIFDDLCKGQPDEYNYFQRNKLNRVLVESVLVGRLGVGVLGIDVVIFEDLEKVPHDSTSQGRKRLAANRDDLAFVSLAI
jgi:hypothetical protein